MEPFKYLHRIDEAGVDSEKKDVHNFTSPKMLRKAATSVWLTYLKSPLSNKSFKESLAITHDHVIPALTDPRVLIDFLRNSYDRGGVVSILALHGLFVLIKDFNLDYPDFYKKLYALFEPSVRYPMSFLFFSLPFVSRTHLFLTGWATDFLHQVSRPVLPSRVSVPVFHSHARVHCRGFREAPRQACPPGSPSCSTRLYPIRTCYCVLDHAQKKKQTKKKSAKSPRCRCTTSSAGTHRARSSSTECPPSSQC